MKNLFKTIDLTKGKIWKVILAFTFPIFISLIFQQIYTITDVAICGKYLTGNEYAGIGNTGSLTFMILQFAFGCTSGFSVVTANAIGKKDLEESRKSLLCQMILSTIVSVVLTLVAMLTLKPMLKFIGVTEESNIEIFNSAYTYTSIIFLGCFTQVFYNLGCCFLRSLGDSKIPLFFLIGSTFLNVGLDFLFIAGLKMGVAGAALATVISQFISAIGCFLYIFIKLKEYRFHKEDFKFAKGFIFRHVKLGVPLGLQCSILAIGLIIMQGTMIKFDLDASGKLGNEVQIGYTTACKLLSFLVQPCNALGTAMLSYTGQNLGANNIDRIKKGVKQATLICLIISIISSSIGILLTIDATYLKIFLSAEKITPTSIKYGNLYLYACMPFYFFLGLIFLYRNSLQGLEKPLFPFLAGVGELVARTVICLFLPTLINGGPINNQANGGSYISFCFADNASWFIAALLLFIGLVLYYRELKKKGIINKKIDTKNNEFLSK